MGNLKIDNVPKISPPESGKVRKKGALGFDGVLRGVTGKVNRLERAANRSIAELLQGKGEIHETMIAQQKAETSMKLLLTIRNKVIDAYREIMRMQF